MAPGHSFALLTKRHMELYGTKASTWPRCASPQRENAQAPSDGPRRDPFTLDDYFDARMISDPLCL